MDFLLKYILLYNDKILYKDVKWRIFKNYVFDWAKKSITPRNIGSRPMMLHIAELSRSSGVRPSMLICNQAIGRNYGRIFRKFIMELGWEKTFCGWRWMRYCSCSKSHVYWGNVAWGWSLGPDRKAYHFGWSVVYIKWMKSAIIFCVKNSKISVQPPRQKDTCRRTHEYI